MNIAVVDDDKSTAQKISTILSRFADTKGFQTDIQSFQSGEEFLSSFEPNAFNIIFMDIYMDKISGIETAKTIRASDNNCLIIFLTTSLEHMPDAFSCHAFDYVVKPIDNERIFKVMTDALEIFPDLSKYVEFISKRKKINLLLSEIVSVASSGHYLHIQDKKHNEYSVRMTLSEFIELIKNDVRFLNVNKGVLVNMDYIKNIEGNNCILTDNRKFPIKVRECALIEQMWLDYNFKQIHLGQNQRPRK